MSLITDVAVAFLLLAAIRWWWRQRQRLSRTPMSQDRRRSYRVALTAPVFVYGWLAGEPFSESTETLNVSANGGLIRVSGTVIPSQEVILTNLQTNEDLTCCVSRLARTKDGTILAGLHFLQASPNFWQIDFVSSRRRAEIPPSPDKASTERAIFTYIGGQAPKMRKNVLMTLVLMAAMMGTALAAKQTAFCPYDGQLAQWTGIQKGTYPNQVCEYKHFFFDTKTKRSVKHVFWHSCDS